MFDRNTRNNLTVWTKKKKSKKEKKLNSGSFKNVINKNEFTNHKSYIRRKFSYWTTLKSKNSIKNCDRINLQSSNARVESMKTERVRLAAGVNRTWPNGWLSLPEQASISISSGWSPIERESDIVFVQILRFVWVDSLRFGYVKAAVILLERQI